MTDTPDTPTTPEGGEPSEKPKNWIQRHPVWTAVIAAIAVVIGISAAAGSADEADSGNRSDDEVATTTTEDTEPEAESDSVDDTTTTVVIDTEADVSQESIEDWVMNGDGLDVGEWMGQIGIAAAGIGASSSDVELQSLCRSAYEEFFESGDILPKMQSAPGELGTTLEDAYFAYEQGFRLCAIGDFEGALPAVQRGTEHLTDATDILSRYAP